MPTHVCYCPKGPYLTGQECPDCRDMSARERRLVSEVRELIADLRRGQEASPDVSRANVIGRLSPALAAYDPEPEGRAT